MNTGARLLVISSLLLSAPAFGQNHSIPDTVNNFTIKVSVPKRCYVSNGYDLAMLSTAFVSKPGQGTELTLPRFTAIVNIGFHFNYDLSKKAGIFTGIGLRNIGFIEREGDLHIKRRVYTLGVPLGFKIGDLRNRNFAFIGGGLDIPFHYKEKTFTERSDKKKSSEWFSKKNVPVMPFVFAGHSFDPGITVKIQYYPFNFMNTDYTDDAGYRPYAGYKVNLLLLSIGLDIHYAQYRIQEREYQELKKEREQAAQQL